ncbi:hypothetical protein LTR56_012633 [Elasticomyces elasticus]|nr:hypothetical protein LTR56_012633 [Elasticomyces elasticus]KAK3668310.1 hypothetical protein LTR22_000995 [Elasticomyces elasticus]KAK4922802.1 hypothetical protein LTR49_009990 [Elasticomyces elasticus]KAK5769365.1 hypothetical protein LTS12_000292 [Elasticomyces elasticus]
MATSNYARDRGTWTHPHKQVQELQQSLLAGNLTELTAADCIHLYLNNTVALHDVVVVASNVTMGDPRSNTTIFAFSLLSADWNMYGPKEWSSGLFGLAWDPARRSWTVAPWKYNRTETRFSIGPANDTSSILRMGVDRCYSAGHETWTNYCAIRYSYSVMIMVCGLNIIKIICIGYTWLLFRRGVRHTDQTSMESMESDHSLVTVGDAFASFLKRADEYTQGMPLATKNDFSKGRWPNRGEHEVAKRHGRLLQTQRWGKAPTIRRWLFTASSGAAVSGFVIYIVVNDYRILKGYQIPTDITNLFATGLGVAQPYALVISNQFIGQQAQFWISIVVANLAQIGVSAMYFLVSGLIAVMAIADEWSHFIVERKTLRLSSPHGIQRSSYMLSLPFKLSLPLIGGMSILHWLISQSVFVIATDAYVYAGTQATEILTAVTKNVAYMVGFSFPGGFLAMIMGISLLVWTALLGLVNKLDGISIGYTGKKLHMPLSSSCSAAISAACHRPEDENAAHLLPVIWARVPNTDLWCFTSAKEVEHVLREG